MFLLVSAAGENFLGSCAFPTRFPLILLSDLPYISLLNHQIPPCIFLFLTLSSWEGVGWDPRRAGGAPPGLVTLLVLFEWFSKY